MVVSFIYNQIDISSFNLPHSREGEEYYKISYTVVVYMALKIISFSRYLEFGLLGQRIFFPT